MKVYKTIQISSVYLQQFTFGKFAAKIRLPYSNGIWPAWWLVENAWNKYKPYWPTVGEIDILKMLEGNVRGQPSDQIAHGTVHWNNASNAMSLLYHAQQGKTFKIPDNSKLHDNSLVYWTKWTPTNISIGINEFAYFQFNTTNIPGSINRINAFNGTWPGSPDNTTVWPQQMIVDWVRVEQLKQSISIK